MSSPASDVEKRPLLLLIDFNIMEGPWDTGDRYSETVSAMKILCRDYAPQEVLLFMGLSRHIIEEAGLDPTDPTSLKQASELCGDQGPFRRRNYKSKLNMFYGFAESGIHKQ